MFLCLAMGMLNYCELGFCMVNGQDWRVGKREGERETERERWGGSLGVRQGKTIVKEMLFRGK